MRAAILVALAAIVLRRPTQHAALLNERYDEPQGLTSATAWNWAGYVAQTGGVTSVSGSWNIPQVQSSSDERSSSVWIGIGGALTNDLIQVGSAQGTTIGRTLYAVFYQILPNQPVIMHIDPHPGDMLSTSIRQIGPDLWLVQATDLSTGQNDTRIVGYRSSLSSAEWIVEAPANANGSIKRLANFGTVHFRVASAVAGNQTIDISNAMRLTMTDGANDLVRVNPGRDSSFDALFVAGSSS